MALTHCRCRSQLRCESVARLSGWSAIITRLAWRQLIASSLNRQQAYYTGYSAELQGVFRTFFIFFSSFFQQMMPQTLSFPSFLPSPLQHCFVCVYCLPLFPSFRCKSFVFPCVSRHFSFLSPSFYLRFMHTVSSVSISFSIFARNFCCLPPLSLKMRRSFHPVFPL